MPQQSAFRTPIPIFIPALSVAVVLTVLFLVGLKEQEKLINDRVEQVIGQHSTIARLVADGMNGAIQQTEASIARYASLISLRLEERLTPDELESRLAAVTEAGADGSIRSRAGSYQPASESGIWIPPKAAANQHLQEFLLQAKQVTDLYGLGAVGQPFVNSWVLPTLGGINIFWPAEPDFVFDTTPETNYLDTVWVTLSSPQQNPQRKPSWTPLVFDPVGEVWMTSSVAPVYWGNEWIASAGHDLPLENLLQRTQLLRQSEGSFFALVTGNETVVASARYAERIKSSGGKLTLGELDNPVLSHALAQARPHISEQPFQRMRVLDNEVFVAHIPQQNWFLLNAIPIPPISDRIDSSFDNLRNIALLALIAELIIATAILAWSHHRSRAQYNDLATMQRQLARSEQHYRTLVDNIPGIVFRCRRDGDWSLLFASPVFEQFTGWRVADFIDNKARGFSSIVPADDRMLVNEQLREHGPDSQPYVLEYRIRDKSGKEHWVLEHGRTVHNPETGEEEREGVILDISALKKAEAQLQALNQSLEHQVEERTTELRNAVRDLETFNYAVSHDLKAPVRQASGFLEAIADELPADASADIRDLLRRSNNVLKRMREMIASLHAYSELNRDALAPTNVNVNDLLGYIVDQFPKAVKDRTSIVIPPIDNVFADRIMLRVVLQHLLDNAVKFSATADKPAVQFIDHSTSAEWMLEIRDNGVGFNPEYGDSLFQIFQRLHSQDAFPGFGVGLALARKIMTLHGGRIWAESEPGKGASFFISIPVRATHPRRPLVNA